MKFNTQSVVLAFLLCVCCLTACTKEDDYKKFTKDGEITYPGRVDTVLVRSGYHRVLLRIALGSDPAVTRVRAYWHDGTDSTEMAVNGNSGNDTIGLSVEGLSEGQYNISVFTFDAHTNESVYKRAKGTGNWQNTIKAI